MATKTQIKPVEKESSYHKSLKKVAGVKSADLALQIIQSSAGALEEFLGEEKSLQTILSSLKDLEPKNSAEARLAMQATVLFEFSMKALRQSSEGHRLDHIEAMANLGIKLARVHNETVEALNRCRRGGVQQVIVQHQNNVMANQVQMNANFNGGTPQENGGTTSCTLENAELEQKQTATTHASSLQWQTGDANGMAEKVVVRGLRKACSE